MHTDSVGRRFSLCFSIFAGIRERKPENLHIIIGRKRGNSHGSSKNQRVEAKASRISANNRRLLCRRAGQARLQALLRLFRQLRPKGREIQYAAPAHTGRSHFKAAACRYRGDAAPPRRAPSALYHLPDNPAARFKAGCPLSPHGGSARQRHHHHRLRRRLPPQRDVRAPLRRTKGRVL